MAAYELYANQPINKGGFSRVYVGRDLTTDETVAMKVFEASDNGRLLFRNEVNVLRLLPAHPNLVAFKGVGQVRGKYMLALEYFPHPTLSDFLESRGQLPEEEALYVLEQLLESITFLASHDVAHRDIKPDNILINPHTLQLKLIDFGLSTTLKQGEETLDAAFIGTPHYMAPQILTKSLAYRVVSADCWSAGLVFWECLLGANPFASAQSRVEMLQLVTAPLDFTAHSPLVQRTLRRLLDATEATRSSASEVLKLVRVPKPARAEPTPRKALKTHSPRASVHSPRE